MVEPIEAETLREKAYKAIKDSILKNELLPDQVFSINSLARDLGISQTPVREAVSRLGADGVIDYEPHKRLRVAKITEEDVGQVYQVRRLLEPCAAGLAATSISQDSRLNGYLQAVKKKAEGVCRRTSDAIQHEEYLEIDLKLNEILMEAVGNTLLREVLLFVGDRSLRIRTFAEATMKALPSRIIHLVTEEHLTIIQAILDGNPEEAREKVLQHLTNAEHRTVQAIRNRLNP